MRRIAIVGAGGHGRVVADAAELAGWNEVIFYDDAWPRKSVTGSWPVVGDTFRLMSDLELYDGVFVAIGHNVVRLKIAAQLRERGCRPAVIIHPSAIVSRHSQVNSGTVVMAGVVVNAGAVISEDCIINTCAVVEHDCRLGRGVHVSPGALLAGGVSVGEGSWVGLGAALKQLVHVGSSATIGAGSVVLQSVPDNCTVVGVPAKPIVQPNTSV